MKKVLYVLSYIALVCAMPAFAAQNNDYHLVESNPLEFSAPIVYGKTSITEAPAGTIVYDNGAQAFFGLTPGGNPSSAGSWIQLGGSSTSSPVTSGGSERVERVRVSATCNSNPCTIATQSSTWISSSGITRSGTGTYSISFNASPFSAAPSCVIGNINPLSQSCRLDPAPSTSGFGLLCVNASGVAADSGFDIICMGPR